MVTVFTRALETEQIAETLAVYDRTPRDAQAQERARRMHTRVQIMARLLDAEHRLRQTPRRSRR